MLIFRGLRIFRLALSNSFYGSSETLLHYPDLIGSEVVKFVDKVVDVEIGFIDFDTKI